MISVVIPAYNEEKLIGMCLDAFTRQATAQKFEVILVDNNSTDDTQKIAKKYLGKFNLKILFQKEKGRGAARNMGFANAKGDILLSTDSDCIVPKNWIEKMTEGLRKSNAVAISGVCIINDLEKYQNTFFNNGMPIYMNTYKLFVGHNCLNGFSFAIYKDIYKKSGGFNSKLNTQEDVELAFRVNKLGKIDLSLDAPVIFSARRFKNGFIKGLTPYAKTFISYFLLKRDNPNLPDVR